MFGLSLVVLAWTEGKRRIPLAFLPYFGEEEGRLDLALLGWARAAGLRPEGVLFDAWYAAKWLHAHGGSFVTRLRSNRVLDGVQLRRHGGTRWVKAGKLRGLTFAEGDLPVAASHRGDFPGASAGTGVEGASALAEGQAAGPSGLGVGGLWAHRAAAGGAGVEFLPMPTETHRR